MGFVFYILLPDKNDYSSCIDSIPSNPTPITEGSYPAVFTLKGKCAVWAERTTASGAEGKEDHTSQKASGSKQELKTF